MHILTVAYKPKLNLTILINPIPKDPIIQLNKIQTITKNVSITIIIIKKSTYLLK